MATHAALDIKSDLGNLSWQQTKGDHDFTISTNSKLLDLQWINEAFSTQDMSWARAMTQEELLKMVDNSLTFGVYVPKDGASQQVGMARLLTDHVTFAYLTDVYVSPDYRRYGLARWLMACVREVMASMPAVRRGMLVTGLSYGAEFYKQTLGFYDVNEERDHLVALTGKFAKPDASNT